MSQSADLSPPGDTDTALPQNQSGRTLGSKGRKTRQSIIDATIELLEHVRLRDITVFQIAKACRIAPGTFYIYFEGVPEVVIAALADAVVLPPQLFAILGEDWFDGQGFARARRFVEEYCQYWDSHRTIFCVRSMSAEEGDERFVQLIREPIQPLLHALADCIARSQAMGLVPGGLQPTSGAAAILTMLERQASVGPRVPPHASLSFDGIKDFAAYFILSAFGIERSDTTIPVNQSPAASL